MISLVLVLLAGAPEAESVSGVKLSCAENVRGKSGRARVEIVVGAGALHEAETERGVAHLVEHLLLRPIGFDDSNGSTVWDATSFYRDVRAAELSTAAVDLVQALAKMELEDRAFELEREVVLRELELRGGGYAGQMGVDPIFGGTILARDLGGGEESVRKLTADDARRFHARYYVRGNVAVAIRGAVSCEAIKASLRAPLALLPDGPAAELPRVTTKEPGPRSLSLGHSGGAFVQGFYWYDATIEDEIVMRLVAKHLEQRALNDLRKGRGLTYSPSADVQRIAGGGTLSLRVISDGRVRIVADWYAQEIAALRNAAEPRSLMKAAFDPVADRIEESPTRSLLAAIRGETAPEVALASLTDASLKPAIARMLAKERAFGSATPTANVTSLVILGLFGAGVLAVVAYVGLKVLRGR